MPLIFSGLTWKEAKARCPVGVVPACHNTEDTVTISGAAEAVRRFVTTLKEEGYFAKEVFCNEVAFHSPYMAAIAPKLKEHLSKVSKWDTIIVYCSSQLLQLSFNLLSCPDINLQYKKMKRTERVYGMSAL